MQVFWFDEAYADYLDWGRRNPRVRDRINTLIEDIQRSPYKGLGKPEPLRFEYSGWWSRRITHADRLVYRVEKGVLYIKQVRFHYGER